MTTVRRSVAFALAENQTIFALQFLGSIVIARLLTPDQIGVYSIAVMTLSFAHVLRDFGVVAYLIKEPDLSEAKVRAAAAISFTVSWTLAATVFLASFPLARFYADSRLLTLIPVLAVNFLLIPFGAVAMAVLRREMQMQKISVIRVASAFLGVTASVILAVLGFGPLSLAIGSIVNTATTMVGARIVRPSWLPVWPSFRGTRGILSFSGQTLTSNLLIEASRAAPDAVLGKLAGPTEVAHFGRASGLVDVFARFMSQAMWSVTLPFFSRIRRDGGAIGPALARAQSYFVGVAWPFYAVLALAAEPVIVTLFGHQWLASIPVLRCLSLFGAATAATMFASTALIAADQAAREVRMTAKVHVLRIVIVGATASLGIVPLAVGLSAAALVEFAIVAVELRRTLGLGFRILTGICLRALALSAVSALPAATLAALGRMDDLRLGGLLLVGVGSLAAWLAGAFLLRHPLATEIRTIGRKLLSTLRRR